MRKKPKRSRGQAFECVCMLERKPPWRDKQLLSVAVRAAGLVDKPQCT